MTLGSDLIFAQELKAVAESFTETHLLLYCWEHIGGVNDDLMAHLGLSSTKAGQENVFF